MEFALHEDKPKYSDEEIRAARLSLVAHALNLLAAYPNNPKMADLAGKIMQSDPVDLLDTIEDRKNPIVF